MENKSKSFYFIKDFSIILWLLATSLCYYFLYPFTEIFSGLPRIIELKVYWNSITHLFCLFIFIISANGWGKIFWNNAYLSYLERFIMATGAGLGFYSLLILVSSTLGLINAFFYLFLLITGVLLFLYSGRKVTGNLHFRFRLFLLISSLPLISGLLGALAPPTQFDSLVYHLALPAKYISAGKFHFIESNIFFSFPQNVEMLFQYAMVLDSDILANLISWSFFFLTGLGIFSLSRRISNSRIGLIAGLIWFFTPLTLFLSTGTYVDLGLTFYVLLGVYAFILWNNTKDYFWIFWSGVFIGIAMGTKYTAVVPFLTLGLMTFYYGQKNFKLRPSLIFVSTSLLVFSPWLIKNMIFLSNPVAPWGSEFFTNSLITSDTAVGYFNHIKTHGIAIKSLYDFLSLPWEITAYGFNFGGGFDISGLCFILFIPVLFLNNKIDKINKVLLIFCIAFCIFWFASGKVLRFLVPVFPFFSIFAAQGVYSLFRNKFTAYVALVVIILSLVHNILIYHWTMATVDPYAVVLGGITRDKYLKKKVNYYKSVVESVNLIPSDKTILFIGETRGYYCKANSIIPTVFDKHPLYLMINTAGGPQDLYRKLKNRNISHLLINEHESNRLGFFSNFSQRDIELWESFKIGYTRSVYEDSYCKVVELSEKHSTNYLKN